MAEATKGGTATIEQPQQQANADKAKAQSTQAAARDLVPFFAIDSKDKSRSAFVRTNVRATLSKLAKSIDNSKEMYRDDEMEKVLHGITDEEVKSIFAEMADTAVKAIGNLRKCMDRRTTLAGGMHATQVPVDFLGYRFSKSQNERETVRGITGSNV